VAFSDLAQDLALAAIAVDGFAIYIDRLSPFEPLRPRLKPEQTPVCGYIENVTRDGKSR
jgi:hypothetical protein